MAFNKIPQPPIDRHGRSDESRASWVGVLLACLAVGIIFAGAMTIRGVVGADDRLYNEYQLNRAFTTGELKRNVPTTQPDRTKPGDPPRPPLEKEKTGDDFCPT
jgi:hypothetical protein